MKIKSLIFEYWIGKVMKTKEKFHKLIDRIEVEKLLDAYFELFQRLNLNETGKIWDSLTDDERDELLISYEESKDPKNLLNHDDVKKQHRKWLKR